MGVVYAVATHRGDVHLAGLAGFDLPRFHAPTWADVVTGFFVLALPQLPLSLGNSVLGASQIVSDLFPERPVSVRRIAFTYSLMNLVNPLFGGVPTCHGAGGMAGHYAFGARTGGSVVLEGAFYLVLGVFFTGGFALAIALFPRPVLGVILLFEALTLLTLIRDTAASTRDFGVVLLVGVIAMALPYGYVIGLVLGTAVAHLAARGFTAFGRESA